MCPCDIHKNFFVEGCYECKLEYAELKGFNQPNDQGLEQRKTSNKPRTKREYKEFSEQRAKKLYEELLIQFLRTKSMGENEAASRARQIIRKQCAIRGIEVWDWLKASD